MNLFELFVKIGVDDKASPAMKNTQKNSETLTNKIKVMSAQFEAAQKNVDKLSKEFNESVQKTGATSKETQELAKKLNDAEKEAEQAKKALDGYNKELEDTSKTTSKSGAELSRFAEKLGNGLKRAAKIGITAISGLTTFAVKSFAEYEQLVGGVETLFKTSSDKVMRYAENAYKTAGLSANEYMSTVTSFSASLLQSLGGDTEKAADYADMAIRDMSDNANKMGTSMEMIQNAYQGFAKQNYTMLDNLKLGYGGTKEEMERLLVDADELSDSFNLQVDASGKLVYSYADIVDAIHIVQDEMGITGTTATEAEKTISGSFNSMKGAWDNFMVALVDSEQDAGEAFNKLWASAQTFLGNLAPKIGEVIKSMGTFGVVLLSVSAALVTFKVVNTIVKGLNALKVATESTTIAQALLNKVMNMNPFVLIATLIAGVVTALITLWNTSEGFREAVQEIWEAITSFFGTAWEAITGFFSGAGEFFAGVWQIIKAPFSGVIEFFSNIFSGAWKAIKNVFSTVGNFFGGIWNTIVGTFKTIGTKIADAIGSAFKSAINAVIAVVEGAINLIPKAINGAIHLINKLPGVEISKIPLVKLPRLERGGVLKRGQVGLLEGNGAEAVVPLERNMGWIKKIAEQLNKNMMNNQNTTPVKVVVGIDENTNYMGLARSLLPLLKVAEKEAYA